MPDPKYLDPYDPSQIAEDYNQGESGVVVPRNATAQSQTLTDDWGAIPGLFPTAPKRTEPDEKIAKRLKTRGMMDALGRIMLNVGDTVTLGVGGIPVNRGPSKTDSYFDRYYEEVENQRKEKNAWDMSEYMRKLREGEIVRDESWKTKYYGRMLNRDQRNDFVTDRDHDWRKGIDERNFDYGMQRDDIADQKDDRNMDLNELNSKTSRAHTQASTKSVIGQENREQKRFDKEFSDTIPIEWRDSKGSIQKSVYSPERFKMRYDQAISDKEFIARNPDIYEKVVDKNGFETMQYRDPETIIRKYDAYKAGKLPYKPVEDQSWNQDPTKMPSLTRININRNQVDSLNQLGSIASQKGINSKEGLDAYKQMMTILMQAGFDSNEAIAEIKKSIGQKSNQ